MLTEGSGGTKNVPGRYLIQEAPTLLNFLRPYSRLRLFYVTLFPFLCHLESGLHCSLTTSGPLHSPTDFFPTWVLSLIRSLHFLPILVFAFHRTWTNLENCFLCFLPLIFLFSFLIMFKHCHFLQLSWLLFSV
jgi:hypothetical protein